jgi:hypothetical protein
LGAVTFASLGSEGTAENTPNARPTANAGLDQCKVKNTTVTLDGSKSSDNDVDVIWAYAWTQQPGGLIDLLTGVGHALRVVSSLESARRTAVRSRSTRPALNRT